MERFSEVLHIKQSFHAAKRMNLLMLTKLFQEVSLYDKSCFTVYYYKALHFGVQIHEKDNYGFMWLEFHGKSLQYK